MEADFWLNRWQENKIGFHREDYHEKLLQYFPELSPQNGQKVLVPLCGKTKDMLWLLNMNLYVHGVELSRKAIDSFFIENNFDRPKETQDQDFTHFTHENLIISQGDFFKLNSGDQYDYIYDRAALVALPHEMRTRYSEVIENVLPTGGQYLLITFEYDQEKMEGPPFNVDANEVHRLFEKSFKIELKETMENVPEGPRLGELDKFKQKVYILTKK
ncbi:MAG: thiopurine S-methyltransferase [Halobacteriovoraceae bacterium]|nr:thiopurine S-methyltransferase [Halobacteriovoraceae bacterium]MBC97417.1 thiopurine S-methyltransferase [Halobacteriovoraceae bacterium]